MTIFSDLYASFDTVKVSVSSQGDGSNDGNAQLITAPEELEWMEEDPQGPGHQISATQDETVPMSRKTASAFVFDCCGEAKCSGCPRPSKLVLRTEYEKESKYVPQQTASGRSRSLQTQIGLASRLVSEPRSQAEAEAGNYPKGTFRLHGLLITLENPKGSTRSGTDSNGKPWSVVMKSIYGYIKGTRGADDDQVDCYIGPHPESELVSVVNQVRPSTGAFDEVKVMLGYTSEAAAREAYLDNYEKNWKGLGDIETATIKQFKEWLKNGDTKKPFRPEKRKKAGASRDDGNPGIQNLAGDENSLSLQVGRKLSEIWCKRDTGLRKMAEIVFGILPGHGAVPKKLDFGSTGQHEELHPQQLSLGHGNRAGQKQDNKQAADVSRADSMPIGLGGRARNSCRYTIRENSRLQMVSEKGARDTCGGERSLGASHGDFSGENPVGDALGKTAGTFFSVPKESPGPGMDNNESIGNSSEQSVNDLMTGDEDFWSSPPNKEGRRCPGCDRLFKEVEPLPDVDMCEVCERYGPPKEAHDLASLHRFIGGDKTAVQDTKPFWQKGLAAQVDQPARDLSGGILGQVWNNARQARVKGQALVRDRDEVLNIRSALEPGFALRRFQHFRRHGDFVKDPIDRILFRGFLP